MTPTAIIAALDRAVAISGEDITLRRLTLGPSGTQIPLDVDCRACVRGYRPDELVADIKQGDSLVILSPTEMKAHQWTWPPRVQTDRVVIGDRQRTVIAANPITVGGELVRVELQVRG
jgi:hypothetical protein